MYGSQWARPVSLRMLESGEIVLQASPTCSDPQLGEPRLTAAVPVENPYCSCKLTLVQRRHHPPGMVRPGDSATQCVQWSAEPLRSLPGRESGVCKCCRCGGGVGVWWWCVVVVGGRGAHCSFDVPQSLRRDRVANTRVAFQHKGRRAASHSCSQQLSQYLRIAVMRTTSASTA